MARQRTMRDVYAIVAPQSPLDAEYSEGDIIAIADEDRLDRVTEFGWVETDAELTEEEIFEVTLTSRDAAVINYFAYAMEEGTLGTEMESGISDFIQSAMEFAKETPEPDAWYVVEMQDDNLVLESELSDGRLLTRQYTLANETVQQPPEEQPQPAGGNDGNQVR